MSTDPSNAPVGGRQHKKSKSGSSRGGFQSVGLSDEVYRGIVRMGFRTPTPVQRKSLPVILTGSDVCVMARTGSGKTCAFLIPILEMLMQQTSSSLAASSENTKTSCRAVILSPTRELSMQTLRVMHKLSHFCGNVRTVGIHGGESMNRQFDLLSSRPDVIVATPGRLAHHLSEIPDFHLQQCAMCVLDEADRLLEIGFGDQIRQIATTFPEHCQKVLLSATMPKVLVEFTKSGFLTDPQVVRLDQEATVSEELRIAFITCRSADKDATLLHVLDHIQEDFNENKGSRTGLTLIFVATRHHVEYITTLLTASGVAVTMIYGALDQEARGNNLADFRSGKKSVLVVTDVAARGIDVPLIDHVVHYTFPPSAKLFVHRSGRAARAGRIGYCWGLVEPDEMPYMVDLHLFLGRSLSTGPTADKETGEGSRECSYTLSEMTPEMVHYGSVPESVLHVEVENVRRIMDSELSGSNEAESLRSLTKVCNNAMKQYRRTRPEASREGVRRAKAILEGERLESGQRLGGASITPHPLLRGIEQKKFMERKRTGATGGLEDAENLKKREDFLRAMASFRPKETVFEAFASTTKEIGVASNIDKGRTTARKGDSSAALIAARDMRRQVRMTRDRGSALVVAGTVTEPSAPEDQPQNLDVNGVADTPNDFNEPSRNKHLSANVAVMRPNDHVGKRRLSKAKRKHLKKNPKVLDVVLHEPSEGKATATTKAKCRRGNDFRDPAFFIPNDLTSDMAESARSRQIDAAMQPSASSNEKGTVGAALRMERAMLDIVGDEHADLVHKQRMMRWDKSKRKYVQTTVGTELSGLSRSKKIRLESGQLVKTDKMKLGEMYEKWQKKTNRSIGRVGVFDDVTDADDGPVLGEAGWALGGGDKAKSAIQIRKEREAKQNMTRKNMKRSERRRLEQRERAQENGKSSAMKGHQRKKGSSGRWGTKSKRKR